MFGTPSMNLLEIEHPGGASMHVSAGGAAQGRVGRVGSHPRPFASWECAGWLKGHMVACRRYQTWTRNGVPFVESSHLEAHLAGRRLKSAHARSPAQA